MMLNQEGLVSRLADQIRSPRGDWSASAAPRPIIAPLQSVYERVSWLAYPLIRVAAGLVLMPHGAQKLFGWFGANPERLAAAFESIGFVPGAFWVVAAGIIEFVGGFLVAVGWLTRPAALATSGLLFIAVGVQIPNGWFWTNGGIEFPLLWAVAMLAVALGGGGRLSVNSAIGREF